MSDNAPLVTVLMTVYDGQAFVAEAVDSVLAQTFADFELLVVDDGSTDATPEILNRYKDPRVRVARTLANAGAVGARNFGFNLARGRYIAALDHDDVCLPHRLRRQVEYLDNHPEAAMVATSVLVKSGGGPPHPDTSTSAKARTPGLMRWMMQAANCIAYSSIAFRAGIVRCMGGFMRDKSLLAEDYDLYLRILEFGDIGFIEEPLTIYRYHGTNMSAIHADGVYGAAVRVLTEHLRDWFGEEAGKMAELSIRHLDRKRRVADAATLRRLADYLERLLAAFLRTYPQTAEEEALIRCHAAETWWRLVRSGIRSGHPWLMPFAYRYKPLSHPYRPPLLDLALSTLIGAARCAEATRPPRLTLRPPPVAPGSRL